MKGELERAHEQRVRALSEYVATLGRVAVAFSAGVDSTVLLHASRRALGQRDAVAVIADSPSLPRAELEDARRIARQLDVRLVEVSTAEGDDPAYRANVGDRCYFCKAALFRAMEAFATREEFPFLAFGEIVDDWSDDRPGARAAGEFGVVAPLSRAGMTKDDVRLYARRHGLEVADKPASACLASRIPIGTEVTPERLATVEAAERDLKDGLGLRVLRVRHHGRSARVEVGADEHESAGQALPRIEAILADHGFESVRLAVYGQS